MSPTQAGPDSLPRLAAAQGRVAPTPAPTPAPLSSGKSDPAVDATMEAIAAATARAVGMPQAVKPAPAPTSTRSVKRQMASGLRMAVVAALVILACAAPVLLVRAEVGPATLDPTAPTGLEFPTFLAAPPAYGTVQMVMHEGGSDPLHVQMVSNADQSQVLLTWLPESGDAAGLRVIADPAGYYFLRPDESMWSLVARDEFPDVEIFLSFARVFTFDDLIPEAVREYSALRTQTTVELDGRMLQQYVVVVNSGLLQSNDAQAYATWPFHREGVAGASEQEVVTIWADATGIVWKVESTQAGDSYYTVGFTLESFSIEPFVSLIPTEFIDLRGA